MHYTNGRSSAGVTVWDPYQLHLATLPVFERPSMIEFKISSFCNWGDCVEVGAASDGAVHLRDSKDVDRRTLIFTREEWVAFVKGVKAGEFDM